MKATRAKRPAKRPGKRRQKRPCSHLVPRFVLVDVLETLRALRDGDDLESNHDVLIDVIGDILGVEVNG